MLKIIDVSSVVCTNLPEETVNAIRDVEHKIARGEKVVVKEKTTKSAVYLNIYEYDKTCWKYLLTKSIKLD